MVNLNTRTSKTVATPVKGVVKATKPTKNFDGREAFKKSAKSELFLAGTGSFYGEAKFYQSGDEAADNFVQLIRKVTKSDPEWVAKFLEWLRHDANIRTAALVGAAEYVFAGGPNGRKVVNSVVYRGDEPAEILAYWLAKHGKRIPQAIKRGVADSAVRIYNEANYAKWNGSGAVQIADVIELTHPKPKFVWQSVLFKYAIDERHGRGNLDATGLTDLINRRNALKSDDPRKALLSELVAGNRTVTWENVSSAGKGKMGAADWLLCYNHMGYMAKLRNLRNLDEAKVGPKFKRQIGEDLANPVKVALSRQLPMRFLSAYRAVNDDIWAGYLSEALDASVANVPVLKGKTLIVVDASYSMTWGTLSGNSELNYYDGACVFAAALAKANDADVYTYSNSVSPLFKVKPGESVLSAVKRLGGSEYFIGGGTNTHSAIQQLWSSKYDRVILLTDEQHNGYGYGSVFKPVPAEVPCYTFNLVGYKTGNPTDYNRITVGGLSDAAFGMIATIESVKTGVWPWEK